MSIYLFLLMLILSGLVTGFNPVPFDFERSLIAYIRYLILLSNIIPISMRVNLEFAKLIYAFKINSDK
jgi:phospholipid-translocating ATPase